MARNSGADQGRLLDEIGWRILDELQADARLSFAELGRRVHLSTPAVAERVRKMEDAGIITGYHAHIDLATVGLPIQAVIRVRANRMNYERAKAVVAGIPEALECHHVTGADDLVMKVAVQSVGHLERVLDTLRPIGDHVTSIVLSTPFELWPVPAPSD